MKRSIIFLGILLFASLAAASGDVAVDARAVTPPSVRATTCFTFFFFTICGDIGTTTTPKPGVTTPVPITQCYNIGNIKICGPAATTKPMTTTKATTKPMTTIKTTIKTTTKPIITTTTTKPTTTTTKPTTPPTTTTTKPTTTTTIPPSTTMPPPTTMAPTTTTPGGTTPCQFF